MKVVCINDDCICEETVVLLKKGNIYTVYDTRDLKDFTTKFGSKTTNGLYYQLIETGHWYHSSLFIPINENQQDENEIAEKREAEFLTHK